MNHMYIRHAVGSKLLLDSKAHIASYEIESEGTSSWKFVIHITDEQAAEQVMQHREEINLFVVDSSNPQHKTWYYSSKGTVEYDKTNRLLIIVADAKLDYSV